MTQPPDDMQRHRIGICSWSLCPDSAGELVERLTACGCDCVQLDLNPLSDGRWEVDECLSTLQEAGIRILSGMLQPKGEDYSSLETIRLTGGLRRAQHWPANLAAAREQAQIARYLGIHLISFHAGFLPDSEGTEEATRERATLLDRLRRMTDTLAAEGVACALETGQETAEELEGCLNEIDRPTLGVNFDPANMILYDKGDPVAALERLAPWVRQVHIKDACRTAVPGTWGREVPVGQGEVDWDAFFDVLHKRNLRVNLLMEREAGEDRTGDLLGARRLVEAQLKRIGRL